MNLDDSKTLPILDAAFQVAIFSKTHLYPAEGTPEFFEFANKLDALATAIAVAYPTFNRNVRDSIARAKGVACEQFAASDFENTMCERCGSLQKEHKSV